MQKIFCLLTLFLTCLETRNREQKSGRLPTSGFFGIKKQDYWSGMLINKKFRENETLSAVKTNESCRR